MHNTMPDREYFTVFNVETLLNLDIMEISACQYRDELGA